MKFKLISAKNFLNKGDPLRVKLESRGVVFDDDRRGYFHDEDMPDIEINTFEELIALSKEFDCRLVLRFFADDYYPVSITLYNDYLE